MVTRHPVMVTKNYQDKLEVMFYYCISSKYIGQTSDLISPLAI